MKNETAQEKEKRIFNVYKKDLEKLGEQHGQIRFLSIEYLCSFPKIDPYKMANALKMNYKIVFDDSTISTIENEKKRKKLENYSRY